MILCVFLALSPLFAQAAVAPSVEQSFWVSVDMAGYLLSDPLSASGTNWAPLTGPYSGLEVRATPWYEAKVNLPGSNVLTEGNNIKFQQGLEITPVSVTAKTAVSFTPIAFLVFNAGVNMGTGWSFGPFQGAMGVADGAVVLKDGQYQVSYADLEPFNDLYFEPWFEGLFQFDVAALISDADLADKLHIVMQTTYRLAYPVLSGVSDRTPWTWQLTGDKFNGWNYDAVLTFGYQLPSSVKYLSLAGVQVEFSGYFNDVDSNPAYNSDFCTVGISPTAVLDFGPHHNLALQCRVMNRRSYSDVSCTNSAGDCNGTEWFFDRFALSYTWTK